MEPDTEDGLHAARWESPRTPEGKIIEKRRWSTGVSKRTRPVVDLMRAELENSQANIIKTVKIGQELMAQVKAKEAELIELEDVLTDKDRQLKDSDRLLRQTTSDLQQARRKINQLEGTLSEFARVSRQNTPRTPRINTPVVEPDVHSPVPSITMKKLDFWAVNKEEDEYCTLQSDVREYNQMLELLEEYKGRMQTAESALEEERQHSQQLLIDAEISLQTAEDASIQQQETQRLFEACERERAALEVAVSQARGEVSRLSKELGRLSGDVARQMSHRSLNEAEIKKLTSDLTNVHAQLTSSEWQKKQLQAAVSAAEAENARLSNEVRLLEAQLNQTKSAHQNEIKQLVSDLTNVHAQLTSSGCEKEQLRGAVSTAETEIAGLSNEVALLKTQLSQAQTAHRNEVTAMSEELEHAVQHEYELLERLRSAGDSLSVVQSERTQLQTELCSLRDQLVDTNALHQEQVHNLKHQLVVASRSTFHQLDLAKLDRRVAARLCTALVATVGPLLVSAWRARGRAR